MGQTQTYQCNTCEYYCHISAGEDYGFVAVTRTFSCLKCNEVVDVVVGKFGKVFEKEELKSSLDPEDSFLTIDDFYICPECNSNNLKPWNNRKRPCPRCKGKMEIDPDGTLTLWD